MAFSLSSSDSLIDSKYYYFFGIFFCSIPKRYGEQQSIIAVSIEKMNK